MNNIEQTHNMSLIKDWKIMIIRLLSGEEIVAEVDSNLDISVDREVIVHKPVVVQLAPSQKQGDVNIHMAPWIPLAAKPVASISPKVVVTVYEPVEPIVAKYREIFGSGIILPTNKIQKLF